MNRITIQQNKQGDVLRICSDEPVEVYFVAPHVPHDRVYLYASVEIGPQFVREEIGGFSVGHAHDGTLDNGTGEVVSPRLPPSKPTLRPV